MDKYLLTDEEMLAEIWDLGFGLEGMEGRPPTQTERFTRIAKAQVAKVLSMFEPVELEALSKTQINMLCAIDPTAKPQVLANNVSRETIHKNRAKGQLFRVKE